MGCLERPNRRLNKTIDDQKSRTRVTLHGVLGAMERQTRLRVLTALERAQISGRYGAVNENTGNRVFKTQIQRAQNLLMPWPFQ
jgi:hypothetical protein